MSPMEILIGSLGFSALFLSDLCQVRAMKFSALISSIIGYGSITASLVFLVVFTIPSSMPSAWYLIPLFLCIVSFFLLIYSVFLEFMLPAARTTRKDGRAYAQGTYALVRHPGFLWFSLACVFLNLWLRDVDVLIATAVMVVLDFLLVFFEDIYVFPKLFADYEDYKRKVPFLIPWTRPARKRKRIFE